MSFHEIRKLEHNHFTISSCTPTRLRLRLPLLHRNHVFSPQLKAFIKKNTLLKTASLNPRTGSLLLSHSMNTPGTRSFLEALDNWLEKLPHSKKSTERTSNHFPAPGPETSASNSNKHQRSVNWHQLESSQTLVLLGSKENWGISRHQADKRLALSGLNTINESKPRSRLNILAGQILTLPVGMLGASALISLATGGAVDALVIAGVVAINSLVGYLTEQNAEKTIRSLTRTNPPPIKLLREGCFVSVAAEQVTTGDILCLFPGDYIAADARLISVNQLSVDESSLTGESIPSDKYNGLCLDDTPVADRHNMVFMGCLVAAGSAQAVVVATGANTEIGLIQTLANSAQTPETPLQQQLNQIGTELALMSAGACGLFFTVGLLRGYGFVPMLKSSISLAVAAVPEGLPAVATTTLALGIQKMRKQHVLIRRLDAVEALGSVQVLCLDKTGTLTENRMQVAAISSGQGLTELHHGQFSSPPAEHNKEHNEIWLSSLVMSLCSEVTLTETEGEVSLEGSATEKALVEMALNAGLKVESLRRQYPLLKMEYRSENRNYMRSIHSISQNEVLLAVKGSPPDVLALCQWYQRDGKQHPLTETDRQHILKTNEAMGMRALRVLAAAYNQASPPINSEQPALVWLGLVGMSDPLRAGIKPLIKTLQGAGIKTVMITGDQSNTAYAIGKELGLSNGRALETLDSKSLKNVNPELLKTLVKKVDVYARVSPANKLEIVQALQDAGQIVAMTGDGINDGPALKASDIGVAMGRDGTEMARSVADVLLEDDNLASVLSTVSEGRTIYANIRKSIYFLLSTNLSEIATMMTSVSLGLGNPLNPMQLLWINLVSDIFPGLGLALEPPDADVLKRSPRNPDEGIIQSSDYGRLGFESLVLTAGSITALSYGLQRYGTGPKASTITFMTLANAQLLHAFSCRSREPCVWPNRKRPANPYLNKALALSFGLQTAAVTVPPLRKLLKTTTLGFMDILVIVLSSSAPLAANEITKTFKIKSAAFKTPAAEQTNIEPVNRTAENEARTL